MAKINLGKMSREELVKLKSDIDAQLKAKEKSARKDALDAIKKAAAAHGFSVRISLPLWPLVLLFPGSNPAWARAFSVHPPRSHRPRSHA
ncbi:MAG: hypothetical protein AAFY68_12795, partial [Pseudomonadota bacterium]